MTDFRALITQSNRRRIETAPRRTVTTLGAQ